MNIYVFLIAFPISWLCIYPAIRADYGKRVWHEEILGLALALMLSIGIAGVVG